MRLWLLPVIPVSWRPSPRGYFLLVVHLKLWAGFR